MLLSRILLSVLELSLPIPISTRMPLSRYHTHVTLLRTPLTGNSELAKTARAGCTNTECKKNGEKIAKDTLRLGVLVTIQEHQTWKWRHW